MFKKIFDKLFGIFILLFILFFYVFISAQAYVNVVSHNISNSVFRIHVIANSDSKVDQDLKYVVRDNLLKYMNSITINTNSKEEAIKIAKEHESDFYTIARNTILENGYDYNVKINIGNTYFPTKNYGDISLPSGNYDALKVEIGEAKRSKLVVRNVSTFMFC